MSKKQRYTVGKWHDLKNYVCAECPAAYAGDGGEDAILRHIATNHGTSSGQSPDRLSDAPAAPAAVNAVSHDRFGQPVDDSKKE